MRKKLVVRRDTVRALVVRDLRIAEGGVQATMVMCTTDPRCPWPDPP